MALPYPYNPPDRKSQPRPEWAYFRSLLDLTVPDDVATGIFEKQFSITNFSREHRLAERLVRRVIRITFYRQSQGYSSPLAEAIAELDQAKIALANNWQSLADFAYLLEDENVARKTLGSLNTMLRSIGLFKQAYASSRSIAEAWLAIGQHPQQQEPTSHQLSIRDGGGASTLAEAKRLLGFLEVVLTVAAAEVGEATLADSVTLERLETGSVDVILKAVPPQLWAKVQEMLARMTNRTGNRLGDLGLRTNFGGVCE